MRRRDRHGGDVYAAAKETGLPLGRILDFSANINPLGPSPAVRRAVLAALPHAVSYPDHDCTALRQALSIRHGLSPQYFLIGNGSTELIHVLPRALGLRHAVILGPTFSEYERSMKLAGGRATSVLATRRSGYQPPLQQAARLAKTVRPRVDAIFLCNPNSPTGQGIPGTQLLELIGPLSRRGIRCIVDEAFIEYEERLSIIEAIPHHPGLVVLRSFTKFFALPGFRLGYVVANPLVIDRIKTIMPPWSANSLAQTAGLASLQDRRYVRQSLRFMPAERERLVRRLAEMPEISVFPSVANFVLVELPPGFSGPALARALRGRGLLIRDCSAVPGLSRRAIRIAVRRPRENDRLIAALRAAIC